jgi:hypothetical protein
MKKKLEKTEKKKKKNKLPSTLFLFISNCDKDLFSILTLSQERCCFRLPLVDVVSHVVVVVIVVVKADL